MLKAITEKIKSNRGASISVALLLFMVCAIVGGVILAAATVSAGRLSQRGAMDQRYYSVVSAARAFAHELDTKEIAIERKHEYGAWVDENGNPAAAPTGVTPSKTIEETFEVQVDGAPYAKATSGFVKNLAVFLLFDTDDLTSPTKDSTLISNYNAAAVSSSRSIPAFTLASADKYPEIKVKGSCQMIDNEKMQVTLTSKDGDDSSDQYTMVLTFGLDVNDSEDTLIGDVDLPEVEASGGTSALYFTKATNIKTTTISWSLISMQ